MQSKRKTLAVIGAGPKGIAVAVKAKVLEEFGIPVDQVVLIEKNRVAANWSGEFGYTNGKMKLGTSPEKDVVFPIETDVGDVELNRRVRKRLMDFTWTAFLVQNQSFSDWIDRDRPAPCHRQWAAYLSWVSEQLLPEVRIVTAEVNGIAFDSSGECWNLNTSGGTIMADRLMLTGPGRTRADFVKSETLPSGVYDIESFWDALKKNTFSSKGRVAVVGAGENAASVLLALAEHAPDLKVDVVSPKGFVSTRAEGYYENQVYSQPERNAWSEMELADRVNFIERTDLGVFSVHAMQILNEQTRHQIVAGRVVGLASVSEGLELKLEYGKRASTRTYDQVILTTGFDQLAMFKSFLSAETLHALEQSIDSPLKQSNLTQRILADLSVDGMVPTLHLPMLAGLKQGPGFANLSCLGRLSDRILLRQSK